MEEQIYFSSDIGRKRRLNEDSGFAGKVNDKKLGIKYLLVVADGMGGHSKGEKASQFAVSFIKDLFLKGGHEKFAKRFEIEAGNRYQYLEGVLENAFFYINNQIKTWGEPGSIGTTLTVALILANKQGESEALIAHIGDSRAYLFYNNQFKQITRDDSLVWELYAAGKISKDDMEKHPSKNVITKAINGEQFNSIQLKKIKIPQNAVLLLCSDGLSGMINDKIIAGIITSSKTIEETGETLIKAANKAGGKDNISVALYSNGYFAEKVKKEKNKKFALIGGSVATLVVLAILAFGAYYFLFNNKNTPVSPPRNKSVAETQTSEKKNDTSAEKENNESKGASNDENEQPKEETKSHEDNSETVTVKFLEPKKQVTPGRISVKINFSGLTPNFDYKCDITPSYFDYSKRKWKTLKKKTNKIKANDAGSRQISLNKIFLFREPGEKKLIVKLYRDGKEIPLKNNKYVFTIKKRTNQKKISEKTTKCVKKDFKYSGKVSEVGPDYKFKSIEINLGKCKGKLKNSNSQYSKTILINKEAIKIKKAELEKKYITIVLKNGQEETITYAEIKEKLEKNKQKK